MHQTLHIFKIGNKETNKKETALRVSDFEWNMNWMERREEKKICRKIHIRRYVIRMCQIFHWQGHSIVYGRCLCFLFLSFFYVFFCKQQICERCLMFDAVGVQTESYYLAPYLPINVSVRTNNWFFLFTRFASSHLSPITTPRLSSILRAPTEISRI